MSIKTFIIAWAAFSSVSAQAKNNNERLFQLLDRTIDSSNVYVQKKENEIRRLKDNLRLAVTATDRFLSCEQVAEAYSAFDSDSAIVYYQRCKNIGIENKNKVWLQTAVLGQAYVLATRGDNFISMRHIQSLKGIANVYPALRSTYVNALMANYVRSSTNISKEFNILNATEEWKLYKNYIPQNSIGYITYEMIVKKNYRAAEMIKAIKKIMNRAPKPSYEHAACHLQLFFVYEKIGDKENAEKEGILAEIENIKLCNRSSPAMTRLLELMTKEYSNNDLNRIIKYMKVCREDIERYRDVGRGIHVVALQNGLLERYQKAIAKVQGITLTVIAILAGFCSLLLWYLRRLIRRGKTAETANKKLTKQVAALENRVATNEKSQAAHQQQLKEEEQRCSLLGNIMAKQYQLLGMALTDIRLHKKEIANLIISGQNQKAVKLAKGSVLRDKTIEEYYQSFDRNFLTIFPNFISEVNKQMRADCQFKPEKEGELSPELRICALMYLGVTDSRVIAEILQYSIQTVYNYTTKIRKGKQES